MDRKLFKYFFITNKYGSANPLKFIVCLVKTGAYSAEYFSREWKYIESSGNGKQKDICIQRIFSGEMEIYCGKEYAKSLPRERKRPIEK